ncbi:ATP-binding cassette domain-containing protein [Celerinatantimonas sp. MCCC 1A17872]|uniref:ATP-binding cassette domain-containing protein n=1 Tax=Celerinatantimonas sp. MCCC 1A17872 TaxID=3177514 RepID=UPI0038C4BA21
MAENIIEVRGLTFSRGDRKIFDSIDFSFPQGKVTAVMGPSGTGKTTLLKLLGGQLKPHSGEVLFAGENIHRQSRSNLYQLRKRMGMLFQSGALFTDLNVFDNVAFPLREHAHLPETVLRNLVLMKLEAVGLRGAAELMPSDLSGGMARRVALARAIALEPDVIMYDEPFVGQDPITMGVLIKLISNLNQALKLTSIVVSHDVEEVLSIADYVYVIDQGKVLAQGDVASVRQSDNPHLQQFLQGQADGPAAFHYPAPPYLESLKA